MPWTCDDGRLAHYEAHPICLTFGLGDYTVYKIEKKKKGSPAKINKKICTSLCECSNGLSVTV